MSTAVETSAGLAGRIENISEQEYRSAPGENFSRLKLFDTSARLYRANPRSESTAKGLGTLGHLALLEPLKFASEVVVFEGDKRTKVWKEFKLANAGKIVVGQADYDAAVGMADSVLNHPTAGSYFRQRGASEVAVFWTHRFGVPCKSRLDWVTDEIIVDPKTSGMDIRPRSFGNRMADYFGYAQLAFYHDAMQAVDGRSRKMVLLAIEQKQPHDVVPYVLSHDDLHAGRMAYEDWLSKLLTCQRTNKWPGICDGEMPLDLPPRVFNDFAIATTVPAPDDRLDPGAL